MRIAGIVIAIFMIFFVSNFRYWIKLFFHRYSNFSLPLAKKIIAWVITFLFVISVAYIIYNIFDLKQLFINRPNIDYQLQDEANLENPLETNQLDKKNNSLRADSTLDSSSDEVTVSAIDEEESIQDNNNTIPVVAITTTLYTTLMTVILSLLGVSVTAFIFLSDSLSNREIFERKIVDDMRKSETGELFFLAIASGFCVLFCLTQDNLGIRLQWAGPVILIVSMFDIIGLCLYINGMIHYERQIVERAQTYILHNQKIINKRIIAIQHNSKENVTETKEITWVKFVRLLNQIVGKSRKGGILSNSVSDKASELYLKKINKYIKQIGDLETLVNGVISNHESEFRFQQSQSRKEMLKNIVDNKNRRSLNNTKTTCINKRLDKQYVIFSEQDFCDIYFILLEIRNCIWIIERVDPHMLPKGISLAEIIKYISYQLRRTVLYEERFKDLNFSNIYFDNANLNYTSFQDSAFSFAVFKEADLVAADFSGTLLSNVDFSASDCKGAVFSKARVFNWKITIDSNFDEAVFDDADLALIALGHEIIKKNGDKDDEFIAKAKYNSRKCLSQQLECNWMYLFQNTSFNRANFVGAKIHNVNFKYSVFTDSKFSKAEIAHCDLSDSNLNGALFAYANVGSKCNFAYANMEKVNAVYSRWGDTIEDVNNMEPFILKKVPEELSFQHARMAEANFANSSFRECDFQGSYSNDASFIGVDFYKCSFQNAILTGADLNEADVKQCFFKGTTLRNTLFTGQSEKIGSKRISEDYKDVLENVNEYSELVNNVRLFFNTKGILDYSYDGIECEQKRKRVITLVKDRRCVYDTYFEGANFTGAEIKNRIFINCNFNEAILSDMLIRDSVFLNCTFEDAQIVSSMIMNVFWENVTGFATARVDQLEVCTKDDELRFPSSDYE